MSEAEAQIRALLRQRHRLQPAQDDDFWLRNLSEVLQTQEESSKVMTYLLAAIASVSLLVGGIGIMNIMLVSVTERTREIGLRMAVGARGRDILTQFLVEAVTLSLTRGVIGIAIGVGDQRHQLSRGVADVLSNRRGHPFGSPPTSDILWLLTTAGRPRGSSHRALRYGSPPDIAMARTQARRRRRASRAAPTARRPPPERVSRAARPTTNDGSGARCRGRPRADALRAPSRAAALTPDGELAAVVHRAWLASRADRRHAGLAWAREQCVWS